MIIPIEQIIALPEFANMDEAELQRKLDAVEDMVRAYTYNNFQNRHIRFTGQSYKDKVYGEPLYFHKGDTVQITHTDVNDGLYVLKEVTDDYVRVDRKLENQECGVRVTKVEYPKAVQDGVLSMLKWEVANRENVGVKSETISRHSVTYYDQDANNTVMGYPVSLLGFLQPYMKARWGQHR